jgi:hypothetical protein
VPAQVPVTGTECGCQRRYQWGVPAWVPVGVQRRCLRHKQAPAMSLGGSTLPPSQGMYVLYFELTLNTVAESDVVLASKKSQPDLWAPGTLHIYADRGRYLAVRVP